MQPACIRLRSHIHCMWSGGCRVPSGKNRLFGTSFSLKITYTSRKQALRTCSKHSRSLRNSEMDPSSDTRRFQNFDCRRLRTRHTGVQHNRPQTLPTRALSHAQRCLPHTSCATQAEKPDSAASPGAQSVRAGPTAACCGRKEWKGRDNRGRGA